MRGCHYDGERLTLRFSGTGGLYHYTYGVCAALQDNVNLEKVRFETASGSCGPVASLVLNLPVKETYILWELRKRRHLRTHGPFRMWLGKEGYNLIYTHAIDLLDRSGCIVPQPFYHTILRKDRRDTVLSTHTYETKEEYASCLAQSMLFWKKSGDTKGWMMDTSYTDPCTSPYFDPKDRIQTPLDSASSTCVSTFQNLPYMFLGFFTEEYGLYQKGYTDCLQTLVPYCLQRVGPPCCYQCFSDEVSPSSKALSQGGEEEEEEVGEEEGL